MENQGADPASDLLITAGGREELSPDRLADMCELVDLAGKTSPFWHAEKMADEGPAAGLTAIELEWLLAITVLSRMPAMSPERLAQMAQSLDRATGEEEIVVPGLSLTMGEAMALVVGGQRFLKGERNYAVQRDHSQPAAEQPAHSGNGPAAHG